MFAGFAPKSAKRGGTRHLVAVVAFDGVVLGDLATPCEVFGRARDSKGRPPYDVRVCSAAREVKSTHLALRVPWRLSCLRRADTVIVPGIYRQGKLELLETPKGLPEGRVRVVLIEAEPAGPAPRQLTFGKYGSGRPSTPEDFQVAEWHGDEAGDSHGE